MLSQNDPFRQDVRFVGLISELSMILEGCATATGMGFIAVARVTEDRWITCASLDRVDFGLLPGDELDDGSTICREVRAHGSMIAIPDVEASEIWRDHHTPQRYGFKSYISVSVIRDDGSIWGTLCALDPPPMTSPRKRRTFSLCLPVRSPANSTGMKNSRRAVPALRPNATPPACEGNSSP